MPKQDAPNEEEVKRAADLREWLVNRIQEVEMELERLRNMQHVVDSVLRKTSFIAAAELKPAESKTSAIAPGEKKSSSFSKQRQQPSLEEQRQLRRSKDGLLIASAFVSPEKLVVVPSSDVKVSQTVPPFQTFFINRILKGYEAKDNELVSSGKMNASDALSYQVEEKDGIITKVTVKNYRDNSRLNEIISTVNWAFTRMLEKK
jgi:hypothetical protein